MYFHFINNKHSKQNIDNILCISPVMSMMFLRFMLRCPLNLCVTFHCDLVSSVDSNRHYDGDCNSGCHLSLCALLLVGWLVMTYEQSPHCCFNMRTALCSYFCMSLVQFNSRRLVESGRHFRETVSELSHLFDSKHYPVN